MKNVKKIDANKFTIIRQDSEFPLNLKADVRLTINWSPRSPLAILKSWIRKIVNDDN